MTPNTPPLPPDRGAEWLRRYNDGDSSAFDALVRAYAPHIHAYLVRSGVAEADRDDVLQEVFVSVHRNAHQFDPSRPLRPWVLRIAINAARTWHRRQRIRTFVGETSPDELPTAARAQHLVEAHETAAWLQEAMLKLPEQQREALLLTRVHGLPLAEAAVTLDVPVNTVKTRVRRARMALAEAHQARLRRIDKEGQS